MAWFIYSPEALPNPKFMGKPGYTPDGEYIRYNGVTLPILPEKTWMELPAYIPTLHHRDWTDKQGHAERVYIEQFKPVVNGRFAERGVIMLDHEPTDAEKSKLEPVALELNLKWRKQCVQWYEDQVREKEITGHGRTKPTPYEDECYEILNLSKPYSVEAFKAQRRPGEEAAERIATAIAEALKDSRKQAAK